MLRCPQPTVSHVYSGVLYVVLSTLSGAVQVMVQDISPSKSALGAMNGLAQAVASGSRGLRSESTHLNSSHPSISRMPSSA